MAPRKGEVNDLTVLPELTELGILEELQARYRRDVIYTNIGDILIAVNPYKDLSIYGPEIGEQYTHEEYLHTLPPHVYAVATRCNSSLWNNGLQQCILVSGESGAGKTESAKMLISQLVRCSRGHRNKGLEEQILEVNPLLEAFGNAETVMNNNSSRFGKLIEIIFSPNGSITGAQITEHMLEKCRAVGQSVQENNFHIFYYLLAGLRPEELDLYFLSNPERYRIVDPGHGLLVFPDVCNFTSCKAMLDGLRHTLGIVGFSTQDMQLIFGTLAAILHLTNIEFVIDPDTDSVIIINEDEIDYASVLLSVQPEDMVAVLLANISFVRGERIVNLKTVPQACDGRDALSKAIYSRLFSWIVQQINLMLCDRSEADRYAYSPTISVLDMAGFENFLVNSFEQLCINVANEQFQSYFNNYVFHLELAEYEREGVKQPKIKFNDNQGILDLFLQRNNGLFAVLDDECRLAKMTDMTMVDKLNQAFVRTEYYRKSRHRDPVFTIAHYAGLVTYNAVGFLDKNRDTMGTNLKSLMENSHNKLITELFTSQILDTGTLHVNKKGRGKNSWTPPEWKKPHRPDLGPEETLSRRAGRKLREKMKSGGGGSGDFQLSTGANTASGYFRNSLSQLMVKISSAEPHFIRCIKPNGSKTANSFDPKLVLNQLHSTGVIETTRIRRLGYSTRLSFQEFLERYKFLVFPLTAAIQTHPDNCKIILEVCRIKEYKIGKSKIFLKYWHVDELSRLLNRQYEQLRTVQRLVRGFLARQHFHRLRQLSFWCYRQVEEFSFLVNKQGEKVYDIILDQYNYDREKHQLMLAERANNQSRLNKGQIGQDSRQLAEELLYVAPDYEDTANRLPAFRQERGTIQPLSQDKRRYSPQQDPEFMHRTPSTHAGEMDFTEIALRQVTEKLSELESDIWCKIFYLEYNQQLAKMYILGREVTVDGSNEPFDGLRIGIGAFSNPERSERVRKIRNYIGKGVVLKRDSQGSILATREGRNDIIVKGYNDPGNHCLSVELIESSGRLPFQKTVKIFDMEEFKSQIGIEMRKSQMDMYRLERLCVVCLNFIKEADQDKDTPCWLCIVNTMALTALVDDDVRKQVQQRITELSLRDVEEEKAKAELKDKYDRPAWSKFSQRPSIQARDSPLRKTRQELRKTGSKLEGHMDYSWQGTRESDENLDRETSPRKDWAKVKAAVKTADNREGAAIRKAKADLGVR